MMTAAFSPMAIAVLYVFDPTFSGIMLMSARALLFAVQKRRGFCFTCNLEILYTINVEPFVNYSTLIARLHGTGATLQGSVRPN
jgi:hypothetical protein